jgi:hypothetical protein
MLSILEKCQTLFSANMRGMIDRTLETKSTKPLDAFIAQVVNNLDELEETYHQVGSSVHILKNRYEESLKESGKIAVTQDYYEQFQARAEQYQYLLGIRMELEGRLTAINQERDKVLLLLESAENKKIMFRLVSGGDKEIDSLLGSIYEQIDKQERLIDLSSRKQSEDRTSIGEIENDSEDSK